MLLRQWAFVYLWERALYLSAINARGKVASVWISHSIAQLWFTAQLWFVAGDARQRLGFSLLVCLFVQTPFANAACLYAGFRKQSSSSFSSSSTMRVCFSSAKALVCVCVRVCVCECANAWIPSSLPPLLQSPFTMRQYFHVHGGSLRKDRYKQ